MIFIWHRIWLIIKSSYIKNLPLSIKWRFGLHLHQTEFNKMPLSVSCIMPDSCLWIWWTSFLSLGYIMYYNKIEGICKCNESSTLIDFELLDKIILGGSDLIRWAAPYSESDMNKDHGHIKHFRNMGSTQTDSF